jgi:hypothetical protein
VEVTEFEIVPSLRRNEKQKLIILRRIRKSIDGSVPEGDKGGTGCDVRD